MTTSMQFRVYFCNVFIQNLTSSGLEDPKISNPFSHQPPLKYTTLPYSYSHVNKLFSVFYKFY